MMMTMTTMIMMIMMMTTTSTARSICAAIPCSLLTSLRTWTTATISISWSKEICVWNSISPNLFQTPSASSFTRNSTTLSKWTGVATSFSITPPDQHRTDREHPRSRSLDSRFLPGRLPSRSVTVTEYPSAYVCNTEPRAEEGEHWIAIYLDEGGRGEYFDSYGLPSPPRGAFHNFLNKHSSSSYVLFQLQGPLSGVCGHYCLFYLLHRARGYDLNTIVHMFGNDVRDNDVLVEEFVTNYRWKVCCCWKVNKTCWKS